MAGKGSKEPQELIIGLGVIRDGKLCGAYSHLSDDFLPWLRDVDSRIPAFHRWFSKCWDQVMLIVLVQGGVKFVIAAHECFGRSRGRDVLQQMSSEFLAVVAPNPSSAQVATITERLKALAGSVKGLVPPRKVLVLYEGAPKRFLTKEEQAPELLEPGGKTRLQRELEDFDSDEDFVFNMKGARSAAKGGQGGEEEEQDDDEFTFTMPPKEQRQGGHQHGGGAQQKQTALIFTSPHVRGGAPSVPPGKEKAPAGSAKKDPSPGMSNDFTWNGVRVSPDDSSLPSKQHTMVNPLNALHSGLHGLAFRGKAIFSAQFEKNGGGRQTQAVAQDGKVRGMVGSIAPSGLSWEDEISSQLAAAGVRCVSSAAGEGEPDSSSGTHFGEAGEEKSPTGAGGSRPRFGRAPSTNAAQGLPWPRAGSINRTGERGLGLGRLAKGFRRTFNRHGDTQDAGH